MAGASDVVQARRPLARLGVPAVPWPLPAAPLIARWRFFHPFCADGAQYPSPSPAEPACRNFRAISRRKAASPPETLPFDLGDSPGELAGCLSSYSGLLPSLRRCNRVPASSYAGLARSVDLPAPTPPPPRPRATCLYAPVHVSPPPRPAGYAQHTQKRRGGQRRAVRPPAPAKPTAAARALPLTARSSPECESAYYCGRCAACRLPPAAPAQTAAFDQSSASQARLCATPATRGTTSGSSLLLGKRSTQYQYRKMLLFGLVRFLDAAAFTSA
ncbi:uncharacterized protein LOC126291461 [Schistocerca gregaria]|uniref:uncharacterized protein LOC126291461 n=1 Tax=Schistocerca gregaria TaxID=7010 RepID=UPI00211F29C1|nr:uncharacterized protein LOC126291461 [Schistocerca gregaria]